MSYGQSLWEGNAIIGVTAQFPDDGLYAYSNAFPLNSQITITNVNTNSSIDVTVVGRISESGVAALLSPRAAQRIGITRNAPTRIYLAPALPMNPVIGGGQSSASRDAISSSIAGQATTLDSLRFPAPALRDSTAQPDPVSPTENAPPSIPETPPTRDFITAIPDAPPNEENAPLVLNTPPIQEQSLPQESSIGLPRQIDVVPSPRNLPLPSTANIGKATDLNRQILSLNQPPRTENIVEEAPSPSLSFAIPTEIDTDSSIGEVQDLTFPSTSQPIAPEATEPEATEPDDPQDFAVIERPAVSQEPIIDNPRASPRFDVAPSNERLPVIADLRPPSFDRRSSDLSTDAIQRPDLNINGAVPTGSNATLSPREDELDAITPNVPYRPESDRINPVGSQTAPSSFDRFLGNIAPSRPSIGDPINEAVGSDRLQPPPDERIDTIIAPSPSNTINQRDPVGSTAIAPPATASLDDVAADAPFSSLDPLAPVGSTAIAPPATPSLDDVAADAPFSSLDPLAPVGSTAIAPPATPSLDDVAADAPFSSLDPLAPVGSTAIAPPATPSLDDVAADAPFSSLDPLAPVGSTAIAPPATPSLDDVAADAPFSSLDPLAPVGSTAIAPPATPSLDDVAADAPFSSLDPLAPVGSTAIAPPATASLDDVAADAPLSSLDPLAPVGSTAIAPPATASLDDVAADAPFSSLDPLAPVGSTAIAPPATPSLDDVAADAPLSSLGAIARSDALESTAPAERGPRLDRLLRGPIPTFPEEPDDAEELPPIDIATPEPSTDDLPLIDEDTTINRVELRPTDERAPPDEDAIATIPESEPDRISEPMPDPITDDSDAVDEGEIRLSLVETDLKPPEGSGDGAEMSIEDLAETGISPSRPDPLRELLNRSLSSRPNNDIEDEPDDLGKTDEVAALPNEREEERVEPTVEDMPPATPEIPAADPAPMVASTPPSRTPKTINPSLEYIQIGVFGTMSSANDAKNSIFKIGKTTSIILTTRLNGRPVYRVVAGPIATDEQGVLLHRFRSLGYRDAFVRVGRDLL